MTALRPRISRLLARVVLVIAVGAMPATAQEFRGGIAGVVADSSGAVLPGVTVTVTNAATNVSVEAVTDSEGRYQARYLNPGVYTVTAALVGFKTVIRPGLEVRVGETLGVDVVLSLGALEETVEVVAYSPVLNTTTGVTGQVIQSQQIQELPLGDGTAYMLTRLAPGITDSSDLHFSRPADNGNLAGFRSNGVQGNNEFSIDGAPNMSNAGGVGFSPPSDAVAEFKVQTNAFDAQAGHTAGAVVNLALKSGTNRFRGSASWFNRDDSRAETPLFTERAGGTKPTRDYNRYGGTVSGPIVRGKTFFMGSFEHLRDVQPEPAYYTVPTLKMRQGDLSEFTAVAIYDPATVTSTGTRTAFPGNVIPANRLNRVAMEYAKYYPEPTRAGTEANYFTNQLRPYDYNALVGRVDHNINESNKVFGSVYWNKRQEDRYNWAKDAANAGGEGEINGFLATKGFDYRANLGVSAGYTATLSPSLLLDLRLSGAEFDEYRDPAQEFDPAKLGFSQTALQLMGDFKYLPLFTFGSFSTTNSNSTVASLGAQRSDWGEGFSRPMQTYSFGPTLTKIWGDHTVRTGYDLRFQRWEVVSSGYPAGRFHFNGAYTRVNNSAATNDRAQSWAQFLLGLPTAATGGVAAPGTTSSQFEIAAEGEFSQWSHGLFVQDDWTISRKLTLNLGFRLEFNPGMSEAENRNLAGFNTTVSNPIEAQAKAAYAANPIPEIPASQFKVLGGLEFADGPTWDTLIKALPRVGAAYALNDKTVVRAGVGLFSFDYFFDTINQQGYSQATPVLVTQDNGITFTGANLTNPIPSGQLVQPTGSALGLRTSLGLGLTAASPGAGGVQTSNNLVRPSRDTPFYTRWQISVQRDLGAGWMTEFMYVGSRGTNLPVFQDINNIPMQYLSTLRSRDTANEAYLTQQVANPFVGLLPGSTINGATVQRQQLLRPYPEFLAFGTEQNVGSDEYHAGTVLLEKRFRAGSSLTFQYTHSSLRDERKFLNPADGTLEDRVSPDDRPNRLSLGGILRLPFGRDGKWGKDWNAILDGVLGGWQLSGTYQYQSGFPLVWGNLYWDAACGDPKSLKSTIGEKVSGGIAGLDAGVPGWDTKCFYFHDAAVQTNGVDDPAKQRADTRIQLGNNVRYFPSTLPDVRTDNLHLLDIGLSKTFALPGSMRVQLRLEAINALNYTVLWNPDVNPRNATFGFVNTDRNNPRDIQIGLKFTF